MLFTTSASTCAQQSEQSYFCRTLVISAAGRLPHLWRPAMRSNLGLTVFFLLLISSGVSEARPYHATNKAAAQCNVTMPCDLSGLQTRGGRTKSSPRSRHAFAQRAISSRVEMAEANSSRSQVVGGRPAGCPRSFCGCGASIRVFGHVVPGLNLAANWLRFPRTSPAPGMVARVEDTSSFWSNTSEATSGWRMTPIGRARDQNSRALAAGYTVVNPRAA